MIDIAGFATMRAKAKSVEAPLFAQRVQRIDVRVNIVNPVGVRRVTVLNPIFGLGFEVCDGEILIERLVVDSVEADNLEEGLVEVRVYGGVDSDVEEWAENVINHLLKVVDKALLLVYGVEPGYLDHPAHVRAVELVAHEPLAQSMPFFHLFAVDRDAPLTPHVLLRFQSGHQLFGDLREILAFDVVVLLEKNLSQFGGTHGIVLVVETIEALEHVLISLHFHKIDREILGV